MVIKMNVLETLNVDTKEISLLSKVLRQKKLKVFFVAIETVLNNISTGWGITHNDDISVVTFAGGLSADYFNKQLNNVEGLTKSELVPNTFYINGDDYTIIFELRRLFNAPIPKNLNDMVLTDARVYVTVNENV